MTEQYNSDDVNRSPFDDVVDAGFRLGPISQSPEELEATKIMAITSATGRIGISAAALQELLKDADGSDILWLPGDPRAEQTITNYLDGRLVVDRQNIEVTVDGEQKTLTPITFKVLNALTEHPETWLSRTTMYAKCWGPDISTSSRTLDVRVHNLRQQLAPLSWMIRRENGLGYKFTENDKYLRAKH